jgi:mannose-6-phosphate isomerase-like protein (cupin superfamily)
MPLARFLTFLILLVIHHKSFFAQIQHSAEIPFDSKKNIDVVSLFEDSLFSSFAIQIKTNVLPHKHAQHSEHVYVVSGFGEMVLGTDTFKIASGDLIFIPKNTVHAVKSIGASVLKVISIQSPRFDGTDRILTKP